MKIEMRGITLPGVEDGHEPYMVCELTGEKIEDGKEALVLFAEDGLYVVADEEAAAKLAEDKNLGSYESYRLNDWIILLGRSAGLSDKWAWIDAVNRTLAYPPVI